MGRLESRVAIVTGGAQGIGRTCVTRMVEQGAAAAVFDVLDAVGKGLVKELLDAGARARYWHVDVMRESDVQQAIMPPRILVGWMCW